MSRAVALLVSFASLLVAQQGGVVEGRVVNSVTHAGVDGVSVSLYSKDVSYEATTNATGGFRISGVTPGEYAASFVKTGFSIPREGLFPRMPPPVHVADSSGPARIDIEMSPSAKLARRVLDGDGNPVAGIEVQADFSKYASTDNDGKFQIDNLEPGAYMLQAKPGQTDAEGVVPLPTYYPSAVDPAQAEPISVAPGAALSGFEIRLRSASVYKLRGEVLDQSGKPAAGATVTLSGLAGAAGCTFGSNLGGRAQFLIVDECPGPAGATARTSDDGTFEFPGVGAGEWSVRADYEGAWDDVRNMPIIQLGSGKVSVSHEDIDDLRIRVAALVSLQATVDRGDTPAAAAPPKASLMLIPVNGGGFANKEFVAGSDQVPTVPAGRTLIAAGRCTDAPAAICTVVAFCANRRMPSALAPSIGSWRLTATIE